MPMLANETRRIAERRNEKKRMSANPVARRLRLIRGK
jgi:hypothetical protein